MTCFLSCVAALLSHHHSTAVKCSAFDVDGSVLNFQRTLQFHCQFHSSAFIKNKKTAKILNVSVLTRL